MKNILLIGVGGTGSEAVDIFNKKMNELGSQNGNKVRALVFDTDAGDLKKISDAKTVSMADTASVGTICDRFGKEYLKEWFPCDDKAIRAQEMLRGASQWRKKSYLSFLNLMNKPLKRRVFIDALEEMVADPGASCEVYVIASVAGGTGSGSFIPIALYAKRYLRKNLGRDPIVNAIIALPDIYAEAQTPENKIKVYANAYAILRELNAINLVSRGYNEGLVQQKKAPINFRIGHPDEPSVGVLFDAADEQFWSPEAAPFSQIFLLDKIPRVSSISAHNIVLANSLYTMLCTDVGSAFDSEFSNHELLRSQRNGSNAIYASISSSQVRFPVDSVLEYLAHKKTLEACDSEWLILHNAVERKVKDNEREAKAIGGSYTMKDGEYAEILLEELRELEINENETILSLVARCLESIDKNDNRITKDIPVSAYIDQLEETFIPSKIPEVSERYTNEIDRGARVSAGAKPTTKAVATAAKSIYDKAVYPYFVDCVTAVKKTTASATDAIFTLDRRKEEFVSREVSLVEKMLKKDGQFLHPVACLIRLCLFRSELSKRMTPDFEKWEALSKRDLRTDKAKVPQELLTMSSKPNVPKSAYVQLAGERFAKMLGESAKYISKKSNTVGDIKQLGIDAKEILNSICEAAKDQLRNAVYERLAKAVDILIGKYRSFFNRFGKEKENLEEETKTALRKDSENVDSIINVYSSVKEKDAIFKFVNEEGGPITDAELVETDNVIGEGVYVSAYSAAAAAASGSAWNEKDSTAYRSLFDNMIEAYKKFLKKSEAYTQIASYNVVEAMVASCGDLAGEKELSDKICEKLSEAQELAKPSLHIDTGFGCDDLVHPSAVTVFMMSKNTGKYIKRHAELFGIAIAADQAKEEKVVEACAQAFIHAYSGNTSARVAIVDSIPDDVLYCTGEVMDITPLRISKFDETGKDNIYFKNYLQAIANFKKYGTDMWNPHLGDNLYKRGYLPYMNEEKEAECDKQMVKALLFAFYKKSITYAKNSRGYNFEWNGRKITDPEGRWIGKNNIAQLLAWLRNEDELIEIWSSQFDAEIRREMNALPSLASDNATEIQKIENALTASPFMKMLTEHLYVNSEDFGKALPVRRKPRIKDGKIGITDRLGPTAIEFAYMIKTSEEISRDCDDAERILSVIYDVFLEMCKFRTNPDGGSDCNPELFIQVYRQQLGNVFEALAASKVVCEAGSECRALFRNMTGWINRAGLFKTISDDAPMDATGKVCINAAFDYERDTVTNDVKPILELVAAKLKGAEYFPNPDSDGAVGAILAATAVEEGADTETDDSADEGETDAE